MNKPLPFRIRTFLVPLAGVALYYFVQMISISLISPFFKGQDTITMLSIHYGTYLTLLSVLMFLSLSIWLFVSKGTRISVKRDIPSRRQWLMTIPIALATLGIVSLYMVGIQSLATHFPLLNEIMNDYIANTSLPNTTVGLEAVGYYIGVGICIPVIEELIFRGIILGEFLSTMRSDIAVILSALIFGTMHIQPIQIGYALVCGLILGYVYLYSNSIFLSIIIHIIFNLLGGIFPVVFADNQSFLNTIAVIEIFFVFGGVMCILYLRNSYRKKTAQGG